MIIDYLFDINNDSIVDWGHVGIMGFSDSSNVRYHNILGDKGVNITDSILHTIILIEVDENELRDTILNDVRKAFKEYAYYPTPYLLNQIRLVLKKKLPAWHGTI
ncbi:MAG: hypothetical protein LRY27_02860 [Chitinophagales bacterium]|nr:hypothetical protein [Chitinophagales bacterium]